MTYFGVGSYLLAESDVLGSFWQVAKNEHDIVMTISKQCYDVKSALSYTGAVLAQ